MALKVFSRNLGDEVALRPECWNVAAFSTAAIMTSALRDQGYPGLTDVRSTPWPQLPVAMRSYAVILRRDFLTHTYPVTRLHYEFLSLVRRTRDLPASVEAIAAEAGYSVDAVWRSWRHEVRRPWIEAGFFVERAVIGG
jgi:hypothetical protein